MPIPFLWVLLLVTEVPSGAPDDADDDLSKQIDYCRVSCGDTRHIACKNLCSIKMGVVVLYPHFSWRLYLLDLHNQLRERVASGQYAGLGAPPQAANMRLLNYDLRLEFTASCWLIAYDRPEKSPCNAVPRFKEVAQNLYVGEVDTRNDEGLELVVNSWFSAANTTTPALIDAYEFKSDAEEAFAVAAWASTTHLGCASVRAGNHSYRLLCNYGPGGAVRGRPVFARGPPRSACRIPSEDSDYASLCGAVERLPEPFYDVGNIDMRRRKKRFSGGPSGRSGGVAVGLAGVVCGALVQACLGW